LKLALAKFTYNNSEHSSTGLTPFYTLYRFNPELGTNVRDDVMEGGAPSTEERIRILAEERKELSQQLQTAAEKQKKYFDLKHKPMRFQVGQKVMLSAKNL
jgi:hypothetical protein